MSAETRKVYPPVNYSGWEWQALTSAAPTAESHSMNLMAGQLPGNLRENIPAVKKPLKKWDLKSQYKLCPQISASHGVKRRRHKRAQKKKSSTKSWKDWIEILAAIFHGKKEWVVWIHTSLLLARVAVTKKKSQKKKKNLKSLQCINHNVQFSIKKSSDMQRNRKMWPILREKRQAKETGLQIGPDVEWSRQTLSSYYKYF